MEIGRRKRRSIVGFKEGNRAIGFSRWSWYINFGTSPRSDQVDIQMTGELRRDFGGFNTRALSADDGLSCKQQSPISFQLPRTLVK